MLLGLVFAGFTFLDPRAAVALRLASVLPHIHATHFPALLALASGIVPQATGDVPANRHGVSSAAAATGSHTLPGFPDPLALFDADAHKLLTIVFAALIGVILALVVVPDARHPWLVAERFLSEVGTRFRGFHALFEPWNPPAFGKITASALISRGAVIISGLTHIDLLLPLAMCSVCTMIEVELTARDLVFLAHVVLPDATER